MRNGNPIQQYLRSVRVALVVPRERRRRVLEEIQGHLDDGVAAHLRLGETRNEAIALAIEELGPPDAVAAAFNEQTTPVHDRSGVARWLPLPLPLLLFITAVGFLVCSLTWIPGGWTSGEKVVQRAYLQSAVITGVLAYATLISIRRARGDRAWRWAAWFCVGIAILLVLGPIAG